MRFVFMGTPDFAVPALAALVEAGHAPLAVYTQPPRPAGRGKQPRLSPIQRWAEDRGIPARHPERLKDPSEQSAFAALEAEVAVVAAYGLILPRAILDAPRYGCLNIHASLLPRWRGAAPIQRAILAGDTETGVTIMQMDAGLDTGPMLLRADVPIDETTTAGALHDSLAELGGRLIVDALAGLETSRLIPAPQPEDGVTYAEKIEKSEARIDWARPARLVVRQIHGFSPAPGAWFEVEGERIKVLRAAVADGGGAMAPGSTVSGALEVACGEGAVRLLEVQRAGRGAQSAETFLRGFAIPAGTRLG